MVRQVRIEKTVPGIQRESHMRVSVDGSAAVLGHLNSLRSGDHYETRLDPISRPNVMAGVMLMPAAAPPPLNTALPSTSPAA